MTRDDSARRRSGVVGALVAVMLLVAASAHAGITGASAVKNAGNSPDDFQDGTTTSYQRSSVLQVLQNDGTSFRTRYAFVVGADVGTFSGTTETLSSDYSLNFTVNAPGAYDLNISTSVKGAFTIVDDGDGPGTADMTAVTGTQSGGTLTSGTLNLSDPGGPVTSGDAPFSRASIAVIQGSSFGVNKTHSLRFTWSSSCSSSNGVITGGDECAVRAGLPITYGGQTAGDYPGQGNRVQSQDGHFVSIQIDSLCGNGVLDSGRGEQCDTGALNGQPGSCCSTTCQLLAANTVCRAAGGACDIAEKCDGIVGTCPADVKSTAVCRPSAGACDIAESCDGVNNACPPDGFLPSFFTCRAAAGVCDAPDTCTGSSAACPADAKVAAGTLCRPRAGACDAAEFCTGSSNDCPPDVYAPNTEVCREAGGACDVAEYCTGSSVNCPSNLLSPPETVCRPAAGPCDEAEHCTGSTPDCPPDAFLGSTAGVFVCRPAAGPCDQQDVCDGSGAACPADAKKSAATICRAASGACDVAEACDGVTDGCPADGVAAAGTTCRAAAGACDAAETCDGSTKGCPADGFAASGTVCRAAAGGCDVAESCTGSSASCPADAKQPNGFVCRASAGDCDVAETCNGTGTACPADGFAASSTVCRAAAGPCDVAETCTGSSATCPSDAVADTSVVCRPASDACDIAETCDGSSIACPPDVGSPDGDGDGACDAVDDCPAVADPSQGDADGDHLGDACDPCTNVAGATPIKTKVTVSKALPPYGDEKLKISGQIAGLPTTPAIDPVTKGLRLIVADEVHAQTTLDVTLPGGAYSPATRSGWKVNGAGTAFVYVNAGTSVPLENGIYKAILKKTSTPGLVKFSASGKNGTYVVVGPAVTMTATIVVDSPNATTGQCGEITYTGPKPFPLCSLVSGGNVLKCQ